MQFFNFLCILRFPFVHKPHQERKKTLPLLMLLIWMKSTESFNTDCPRMGKESSAIIFAKSLKSGLFSPYSYAGPASYLSHSIAQVAPTMKLNESCNATHVV